jgi:hypothetical protein
VIKLDKLKIVTNENHIIDIDPNIFTTTIKNGQIVEYRYEQQYPYLLYIEKDLIEHELVIEFTGKILQEQYPLLINKHTIRQCLDNINILGICHIDVSNIITAAHVVKADITQDICCGDYEQLIGSLRTSIKNYNKYLSRVVNGTFVIEKNVVTRSCKLRMTIYNKADEMRLKTNQDYLFLLPNTEEVVEYFADKVRFELNLNSKEQIRKQLNLNNTMLYDVLHSDINPIVNFMDKVFEDEPAPQGFRLRDLERLALLEKVGMDMNKLEMIVRQHSSPKSHISQLMLPYRNLLKTIECQDTNYLQTIRNLLLEK